MKPELISIKSLFSGFVSASPDKRFLFSETESYTAAECYGEINAVAADLKEMGVKEGSLVALRSTRSVGAVMIYFALQFIGAQTILVDPHKKIKDYILESGVNISPEYYITNENCSLDISCGHSWNIMRGESAVPLKTGLKRKGPEIKENPDATKTGVIIFTSGSTGKSKGVILTQYNYLNHGRNFTPAGCYRPSDVQMEMLPIFHVFGLAVIFVGLINRYEIFFPKEVNPGYIAECIVKYRVTRLDGVPSFALAVANYSREHKLNITSLRVGVIGGAPVAREQFDYIESTLGLKLCPVYGMSECIGITGAPMDAPAEKRNSTVGKFLEMNEGKIVLQGGSEAPVGCEGEIIVRSPAVTPGYYGDPDATAEAIDAEGFLHTGDLGYMDSEGYLHISGRLKDIIIVNGNNISAAGVEMKLSSLPCVDCCVCVGAPDSAAGEKPCVMVKLKSGCTVTAEELRSMAAGVLTKLEMPKIIEISGNIPMLSAGKPDKQKIKKYFTEK